MCFAFADVRFGEIKVILAPVVDLFSFLKSVKLQGLDRGCLYTFWDLDVYGSIRLLSFSQDGIEMLDSKW